MNVSPLLVQAAKKVKEEGTEKLQSAVRSGEVSVSAAAEVARLPKEQQDQAVASGKEDVARPAEPVRPSAPAPARAADSAAEHAGRGHVERRDGRAMYHGFQISKEVWVWLRAQVCRDAQKV